jgi:hypothetical protein
MKRRWRRTVYHDDRFTARAQMLAERRAAELFATTDWCQPRLCGRVAPDTTPGISGHADTDTDSHAVEDRYALP